MVENHEFNSLSHIWWRNSNLDFSSIKNLFISLEEQPGKNILRKKEMHSIFCVWENCQN